jgi:AraC-like DNA-binding protein
MQTKEWTRVWHNPQLDVGLLHAFYVEHAFPRHSHDYYVLGVIKEGVQSFTHRGTKQITPPRGAILINPDEAHTGEAADGRGFEMLCIYPTPAHMQAAVDDLNGQSASLPFFKEVRVDHPGVVGNLVALHQALTHPTCALECESRFVWTLAELIRLYADVRANVQAVGRERKAVQQARQFIEEGYAQGIHLTQLAEHVSLSPYYLLRVFRAEVGMPPYAYLESVRIRQAQRLIEMGKPLAEVAAEVGFSSQSHLTQRFKQIIGVTPGQFAQQART